jgi:hypothetical protein
MTIALMSLGCLYSFDIKMKMGEVKKSSLFNLVVGGWTGLVYATTYKQPWYHHAMF